MRTSLDGKRFTILYNSRILADIAVIQVSIDQCPHSASHITAKSLEIKK